MLILLHIFRMGYDCQSQTTHREHVGGDTVDPDQAGSSTIEGYADMHSRTTERVPFFSMNAVFLQATLIISLALGAGACTMNETAQRTGSGAAIGAAAGALLGGRSGAAWGAAVGAGGGYLVDQTKKRESTEAENQRLREENYRLQQQAQ